MLEIKNITKRYNEIILDNINYTFSNTGLYFITGPSGSGKSTLFNIIGGLEEEYEGKIIFDNNLVTNLNKYRKNNIGFVFQNFYLLDDYNVKENMLLTKYFNRINKSRYRSLLKKFMINDLLEKKVTNISGGQKQRVALIRALNKDADILLCDEPTGSLDRDNSKLIFKELKEISKTKLVIVISHDTKLAHRYGDIVLRLDNHKLVGSRKIISKQFRIPKHNSTNKTILLALKETFKNIKLNYKVIFGIYLSILCIMLTFSVLDGTINKIREDITSLLPNELVILDSKDSIDTNNFNNDENIDYIYQEPSEVEFLGLHKNKQYIESQSIYISDNYNFYDYSFKNDNDIVLSKSTALKLFDSTNIVDKKVYGSYSYNGSIKVVTYNVVAVTNKNTLLDTMYIKEGSNINIINKLYGIDIKSNILMVTCKDANKFLKDIKESNPTINAKISNEGINENINSLNNSIKLVLFLFSFLAIVSSVFLVGEVRFLSVIKRKKKLAIFKVLGAKKSNIYMLVMLETFIIISIAFVNALMTLLTLSTSINEIVARELFGGGNIIVIDYQNMFFIYVAGLLLGTLASLLPARFAYNMNTIDTLRS